MADEEEATEEPEEALDDDESDDDEDGEGPPKKKGKAKLFIIIGAVVFLLIGAGAGVYLLGYLDSLLGLEEVQESEEDTLVQGDVFYKLEEITLNLNQEGKKSRFLKIGLTIVLLHDSDVASMEYLTPRITDYVSTYLRELRPDEAVGSANIFRVRENVLLRVRAAVAPIEVTNVLFNSLLVQ